MMFLDVSVVYLVDSSAVLNQVVAPIQNFEPSWTASSVGGTTIAIPFVLNDMTNVKLNRDSSSDAVVVVFRTTSPQAVSSSTDGGRSNHKKERLKSSVTLSGLRLLGSVYTTSDAISLSQSSQRWTFLGSTAVCTMTGFSPDIDYLTRLLQKLVDSHRTTYDSSSLSKTTIISTMILVDSLAEELQEAGQWQGGRPFGVQALIVGRDSSVTEKTASLGMFTLDPSGGYRRWRGAAAIGRNSKIIRDRLLDFWMSQNDTDVFHNDGIEALSSALQVSVLSRVEESEDLERSDIYEAIVVWQSDNEFCVANIDAAQINEIREMIRTKHKGKST